MSKLSTVNDILYLVINEAKSEIVASVRAEDASTARRLLEKHLKERDNFLYLKAGQQLGGW